MAKPVANPFPPETPPVITGRLLPLSACPRCGGTQFETLLRDGSSFCSQCRLVALVTDTGALFWEAADRLGYKRTDQAYTAWLRKQRSTGDRPMTKGASHDALGG